MIVDNGSLEVQRENDSWGYFSVDVDTANSSMTVSSQDWSSALTYKQATPSQLSLTGPLQGHQVRIQLHSEGTGDFLLVRRGFHWINEYPFAN